MKHLIKHPVGPFQIIAYTGEMNNFGIALAEAAITDPQLGQQILFAANELKYHQYSRDKGIEMIELILNPQKN